MSAPAAAPPAPGILFIRGEDSQNNAEVCFDSQLLSYHRVAWLLYDNAALSAGLGISPDQLNPKAADVRLHLIKMPETALLTIHILLALHEAVASNAAIAQLDVTVVKHEALFGWFDPAHAAARADMLSCGAAGAADAGFSALRLHEQKPKQRPLPQFAAQPTALTSKVRFRFCRTLGQALHRTSIRVVYLANLMWFQQQAPRRELLQSLDQLLVSIQQLQRLPAPPRLYPPHEWDELLELKHKVYQRFHSIMLPTRWFPLHDNTEAKIRSTADWLVKDLPPGTYVLKGNYSDAGDAVRCDIVLTSPGVAPAKLHAEIKMLATKWHQTHFGLQEQQAELRINEFRHYCFALPGPIDGVARFRLMVAVRTHAWQRTDMRERGGGFDWRLGSAHISIPSDDAAIACYDLVQDILTGDAYQSLRAELIGMGCSALRIDCGYDSTKKRAYLCELTSPASAGMFHFAHETELVWLFGRLAAQGLVQKLA